MEQHISLSCTSRNRRVLYCLSQILYTDRRLYRRSSATTERLYRASNIRRGRSDAALSPTMEGVYRPVGEEPSGAEVTLASITVPPPTKLEYTVGEELATAGMTVTAVYSDESQKT